MGSPSPITVIIQLLFFACFAGVVSFLIGAMPRHTIFHYYGRYSNQWRSAVSSIRSSIQSRAERAGAPPSSSVYSRTKSLPSSGEYLLIKA